MKKAWLFSFLFSFVSTLSAQPKPTMLMAPANWQFEQFTLPPGFAPAVKYHGLEELRFSPGWDKKESRDYFTVIWGYRFDDTKTVSAADLTKFLQTYFRGLCDKTAKDRHLPAIDPSAVTVSIQKKAITDKWPVYNGTLHIFGVFADGAPVTLNAEIKVMKDAPRQRVYLLMIASPQPKADPVWQELFNEQHDFVLPAH